MNAEGIFYVFAHVSDLARSRKFYSETLGWELGTDTDEVAGLAFGGGYLVIRGDDRPPGSRRYAGGMQVCVRVADVDAEHARLAGLGVPVTDPVDQHWGERNFTFTDPDGYVWTCGQPR